MNRFAAIIVAAICATPADAEYFTLHRFEKWEVGFIAPDNSTGEATCVASTSYDYGGREIYLSIDVAEAPGAKVFISDSARWWSPKYGTISILVDDMGAWTAPVFAAGDMVAVKTVNGEFLIEVSIGKRLYVDFERDGEWDVSFSLAGSAAAITALADCKSKLGSIAS